LTFKSFIKYSLSFTGFLIIVVIAVNMYWNPYGIWGDAKGKELNIITDERTSKYLMGFNYIPNNFEGLIIGPSLSANMNPQQINGYKIYNASMNGSNITEIAFVVRNIIEHDKKKNIKFVVLCLNTYIVKNHGMKTTSLNPKQYYGTLGSLGTISLLKSLYWNKIHPEKNIFHASTYGFNDFNIQKTNLDSKKIILNNLTKNTDMHRNLKLDEIALEELKELIEYIKKNNIKIFAYVYPRNYYVYEKYKNEYNFIYQKQLALLLKNDTVIDFFNSNFDDLRKDYYSYSDGSHLSNKGTKIVLKEIENVLNMYYGHNK